MSRLLWLALARRDAAPAPPPESGPFDDAMMARALLLAEQAAAMGEVPVGAVVYRSSTGEVLGEGFNRRETDHDPAAHAELLAVRRACARLGDWRLNECSLAVTLEPCAMCAGLIVNARLGRLVFGATDPKAGAVASLYHITEDARLNHRVTPVSGVMAPRASALLRSFFSSLRRRGKA